MALPFDPLPDPFAPAAAAPPAPAASAPPAAEGAPAASAPAAPGFVPETAYNALKTEVDRLKPLENLAFIGEAMADPQVAARVRSALFNGPGAPQNVTQAPPVDPAAQSNAIRAKYDQQIKDKLAAGDVTAALMLSGEMGAELTRATLGSELQTAAGPILSMTAQNTIEGFYNAKRASSPIFAKIEPQVRAFVAQTPPAAIAQLVQNGQLHAALETAYKTVLADSYEAAYGKSVAATPAAQVPPPYSAGGGGGPLPAADTPAADDKDDEAFRTWAAEKGIKFTMDGSGALIGEQR